MDEEMKKLGTDFKTKKMKNISASLATEGQKKELPVQWEVRQNEYDSGPKMGID